MFRKRKHFAFDTLRNHSMIVETRLSESGINTLDILDKNSKSSIQRVLIDLSIGLIVYIAKSVVISINPFGYLQIVIL